MAIDRFVYWKKKKPAPALKDISSVLANYLGDAGKVEELPDEPRIIAILTGAPRFPFRDVPGYENMSAASEQHKNRWLEVFVDDDNIDVITRQTDEFTNVVAEGFAKLAARFWEGKYQENH